RETLATLVDLYEDRFPDFSKEETTRLARESMSDLFSKAEVFLELWLGACATLQESTYDRAAPFSTEHGFNQGIAIDLRPRWQPNSSMLEWYLMEVNASDQQQHKEIGISGLKSANPYLESFTSFRSSHGYRELRVPS
ncbi:MAG: hypothetical protein KDD62_04185, partial [Bdellovibrionales bacterium]|nr:hypothetical protein [Bdellovibrionales bacterium]